MGNADLNNLININIRKGILQKVFTNYTDSTVRVCYLDENTSPRVPIYSTQQVYSGDSRENAELWQAGDRVYLTEDTYLRSYETWSFGFLKMYN